MDEEQKLHQPESAQEASGADKANNIEASTAKDAHQATPDEPEAVFIGTYAHTLDTKGRMIVPQAFRELLGETFCIGPSFNFKSIGLYPNEVWKSLRAGYARKARINSKLRLYLEQFDAMSYRDQECDGQGRVLLPLRIRQRILGEDREVEIAGAGEYVRVAASASSDALFEAFLETLDETLDVMDSME